MHRVLAPDALPTRLAFEKADTDIRNIGHRQNMAPELAGVDLDAFVTELKSIERVAYFARRFFDCQLFLVQAR